MAYVAIKGGKKENLLCQLEKLKSTFSFATRPTLIHRHTDTHAHTHLDAKVQSLSYTHTHTVVESKISLMCAADLCRILPQLSGGLCTILHDRRLF